MALSNCPCLTLSTAMSCLDAKISLVPKHQLIVPSTLLAPATESKHTKPQRYIRSNHWHMSYFEQRHVAYRHERSRMTLLTPPTWQNQIFAYVIVMHVTTHTIFICTTTTDNILSKAIPVQSIQYIFYGFSQTMHHALSPVPELNSYKETSLILILMIVWLGQYDYFWWSIMKSQQIPSTSI